MHKAFAPCLLALLLVFRAPAQETPPPAPAARPRLIVLISVDQLADWVLRAAEPWLGEGGIARLLSQGTRLRRCAFAHSGTFTGPGHATLATGAWPSLHGIIDNSWIDPATGEAVYCVGDPDAKAPKGQEESLPISPRNLLAPTLGDTMKAHLGGAAKVVSVAIKDRAAVLMGGRSADVAVWFSRTSGTWVTSDWYGAQLPSWLAEVNAARPVDAFFGRKWERAGPPEAYAGLQDDRPFERPSPGKGRTLPQVVDGGEEKPGPRFYAQLVASPFSNDLLVDLAEKAVKAMGLGRDAVPDLLCVGLSANDVVGHMYGPRSVEVQDMTLRMDRQVARLLSFLDASVGIGSYCVILSADHGAAPAPAGLEPLKVPSGQAWLGRRAQQAAEEALEKAFGDPPGDHQRWVLRTSESDLYLRRDSLGTAGVDPVAAQDVAGRALRSVPGIAAAVGLERALRGQYPQDHVHRSLARRACPLRSGDVLMAPAPYWISRGVVASHGTPYTYDQQVPLLLMGPGIRAGYVSPTVVTPGAGVVVAAGLLQIPAPAMAADRLPMDVLR